jgi:hypothetical protein
MIKNKLFAFAFGFVLFLGLASAAAPFSTQTSNPSLTSLYSSSDISTYWPTLAQSIENGQCEAGTDFLVMIPPAGCSPSVVRSDLLEEQNVPVFCKLEAINVNPLIDVDAIDSISYRGTYPKDVVSVSYHPARAIVKSSEKLLNNPVANNIGYVVIVLKKQANESGMPEWVFGNLTATIKYDAKNAFGVGQAEFYLKSVNDESWQNDYVENSFWDGKGYLRLKDISGETAKVVLYTDKDKVYREVSLKVGEKSAKIYFPGFYCQAGMRIQLNSIVSDQESAKLDIDGDTIWVRQGTKFLDDACTVSRLNMGSGGAGSITFSCKGKSTTLSLLGKNVATINSAQYELGQKVVEQGAKNLYLGYVGSTEKKLFEGTSVVDAGTGFVVLINESSKSLAIDNSKLVKLSSAIANFFEGKSTEMSKTSFETVLKNSVSGSELVILYNQVPFNANADESIILNSVDGRTVSYKSSDDAQSVINGYFNKMDSAQNDLTDLYPNDGNPIVFGSKAISEEIKVLESMVGISMGKTAKTAELIEKFSKLYSTSALGNLKRSSEFDYSDSFATVYANNEYNQISLLQFKGVDKEMKSAEFFVNSRSQTVYEGDSILADFAKTDGDYFSIRTIDRNYIEVDFYKKNVPTTTGVDNGFSFSGTFSLKNDEEQQVNRVSGNNLGQYRIMVNNIQVAEVASVSLIPELATKSEANFTYRIGIEKRAIELSPEMANKTAMKINETIKKWEEANAKLGKLVESWKGACLVTSGVLQIKTLFGGFTGAATARQKVMDTYKERCKTEAEFKGMTSTECYAKLNANDGIDMDVEKYSAAIKVINAQLNGLTVEQWKTNHANEVVCDVSDCKIKIVGSNLNSWTEIRAYLLYKNLGPSSGASASLQKKIKSDFTTKMDFVANTVLEQSERTKAEEQSSKQYASGFQPKWGSVNDESVKVTGYWNLQRAKDVKDSSGKTLDAVLTSIVSDKKNINVAGDTPVEFLPYNGKKYLLILSEGETKSVADVYSIDASGGYALFTQPPANTDPSGYNDYNALVRMKFIGGGSSGTCKNPYKATQLSVEFYESGANKGFPAKVPFDKKEGWYVKISQSTGGVLSDSVKAYQASGAVSYFSICNVGVDGVENTDDKCTGINFNNNLDNVKTIADCPVTTSQRDALVNDAKRAIQIAQQNYGKPSFDIQVGSRESFSVKGTEAVADLGYECEDFMSADDCHILYNVCDPVICPASRCNFGGKFKVANVIQSGVLGSALLCLPNFGSPSDGKVIVPVCLTGIHAGIEGWISILKSSQKCLMEAAATGKHAGICDEITSVYKCEFFWKQVSPLMETLVPKLAESVYNFGTNTPAQKGGGEYMTFQQSWENMQSSIDYFKNTYASTSFSAFKFGNVEEVGTEVCRNFIGTSVPSSASALDQLLKPESPSQFYAQFSEISFTDATVPPTSQYKVYYHIYAGTDAGVRYQVYLKDPPATSYVYTSNTISVATGFIGVGSEVDEAKDFSAPAGYKQLCVVINNQEECGFKAVTTDAGLDALHDSYVLSQATNDSADSITTEKACSQGTSSALSLANLNLQAGVEETINPDITLRGIVRVCSTSNPGLGKDDSNWKNVGYCGDKSLTCWLDQSSLNNGALEVLSYTNSIADAKKILAGTTVLDDGASKAKLTEIKGMIDGNITNLKSELEISIDDEKKLVALDNYISGLSLYSSAQRAELLYSRFDLNKKVVEFLIGLQGKNVATNIKSAVAPAAPVAVTSASTTVKYSLDGVGSLDIILLDGKRLYSDKTNKYYYHLRESGQGFLIMKVQDVSGKMTDGISVGNIDVFSNIIITSNLNDDKAALADLSNYKFENNVFVNK